MIRSRLGFGRAAPATLNVLAGARFEIYTGDRDLDRTGYGQQVVDIHPGRH